MWRLRCVVSFRSLRRTRVILRIPIGATPGTSQEPRTPFDIVPKDLRQHIAREAKDDVEIYQLRQKARTGATAADAAWGAAAVAAVASGGWPTDPAAAKDKKKFDKGKGKGKKPDKSGAAPAAGDGA